MADLNTPQPGTEASNPIDAAKVAPSQTTFGFSGFTLPTPKWANAAFDIFFIIATAFLSWIVADQIFPKDTTQHIIYFFSLFLFPVVKGISKMFGVKTEQPQSVNS